MQARKYITVFAALSISLPSAAQHNNYQHLGARPASGQVETEHYRFQYSAPSRTYDSITWDAYRDRTESRNTVMVIGLRRYDTYALSVLYKGTARTGQSALEVAQEKYPSLTFGAGPNPACANTPLERPAQLPGRLLAFVALCVDRASESVYEVNISWQSIVLATRSLDSIVQESVECAAAQAQDPSARCPDRIGVYARSYETLLSSFAATGAGAQAETGQSAGAGQPGVRIGGEDMIMSLPEGFTPFSEPAGGNRGRGPRLYRATRGDLVIFVNFSTSAEEMFAGADEAERGEGMEMLTAFLPGRRPVAVPVSPHYHTVGATFTGLSDLAGRMRGVARAYVTRTGPVRVFSVFVMRPMGRPDPSTEAVWADVLASVRPAGQAN